MASQRIEVSEICPPFQTQISSRTDVDLAQVKMVPVNVESTKKKNKKKQNKRTAERRKFMKNKFEKLQSDYFAMVVALKSQNGCSELIAIREAHQLHCSKCKAIKEAAVEVKDVSLERNAPVALQRIADSRLCSGPPAIKENTHFQIECSQQPAMKNNSSQQIATSKQSHCSGHPAVNESDELQNCSNPSAPRDTVHSQVVCSVSSAMNVTTNQQNHSLGASKQTVSSLSANVDSGLSICSKQESIEVICIDSNPERKPEVAPSMKRKKKRPSQSERRYLKKLRLTIDQDDQNRSVELGPNTRIKLADRQVQLMMLETLKTFIHSQPSCVALVKDLPLSTLEEKLRMAKILHSQGVVLAEEEQKELPQQTEATVETTDPVKILHGQGVILAQEEQPKLPEQTGTTVETTDPLNGS